MSWQAMEAVQDRSAIEDHTALSIFYALARHADCNGIVGVNGRLTSPSIDTIARLARCHRNTVLNWLPKMEETGELAIERLGAGRGAWNRYTINLPMPDDNGTSEADNGTSGENNGTSQDVPKLELMVQGLSEKIDLLVQVMVHNGTSQGVLDTKDTKDKYIYMPPLTDEQQAIITKLTKICKTPYFDKAEDEYRETALMLIGWDATPESVEQFAKWWARNGWHKGLPELVTVAREYRNFLNGVVKKPDEAKGSSWTPA